MLGLVVKATTAEVDAAVEAASGAFSSWNESAFSDRADLLLDLAFAIAEPILDKPQNEISIARLLGQLFQITETFQMETQPQLLLLQKTMLVAEGVGRRLAPELNMWQLAQPLIEEWMRENRGPEAQLADITADAILALQRLPAATRALERAATTVAEGRVALDLRHAARPRWPIWGAVGAALALALIALID